MALAAGAVVLVAAIVAIALTLRGGVRPEEDVAHRFVVALLAGDAAAAYDLTAPDYQVLVRAADLDLVATALHDVAGDDATVDVLGSERTPGASPATSLVGYRGRTDVGRVEGVVTLVRHDLEGAWLVRDLSYRFPEASDDDLAELSRVTRELNEALAERAGQATQP